MFGGVGRARGRGMRSWDLAGAAERAREESSDLLSSALLPLTTEMEIAGGVSS